MIRVLTSDGSRWFFHHTEGTFRHMLEVDASIHVSSWYGGEAVWRIIPAHVVAFVDMGEDDDR